MFSLCARAVQVSLCLAFLAMTSLPALAQSAPTAKTNETPTKAAPKAIAKAPTVVITPELGQDLLGYAGKDNLPAFMHLLSLGVNINVKRADRYTPLMMAAENGSEHVLDYLISQHVNLDDSDLSGETALFIAARADQVRVIHDLAIAGALVDKGNGSGITPLMIASADNHADSVVELVKDGAKVDAQDIYENTALIIAAKNSSDGAVEALLSAKANVEIRNAAGFTALRYAEGIKNQVMIAQLSSAGGTE